MSDRPPLMRLDNSAPLNAYDEVCYPNRSYFRTHPDCLATHATLMGLEPPPVATCRVLEIGCGRGGNLVAMAAGLPEGRFVGIDLAESAIADASSSARELGLENITFLCADIGEIDYDELGVFDYIISHGVFSWVPEPVRDQMLKLCGVALADNGVAYISYNAYPGCHQREMSRRMMRFHVRHLESPADRIGQGRSFLNFLVDACDKNMEGYHQMLKEELKHALNYNEAAFYHDDLSEINAPYYFHEFVGMASAHGLQFLAESNLRIMNVGDFPPNVVQMLQKMEQADYLVKEQYLDFLNGRRFRETLLCRDTHLLDRAIVPGRITGLRVAAQISPILKAEGANGDEDRYMGPKDSQIASAIPVLRHALRLLSASWPESVPFKRLQELSGEPEGEDTLANFLIDAAMGGVVEFHTHEPAFTLQPGEKPVASPVARLQVQTHNVVTTLRHDRVLIDDKPSSALLTLMDGTRNRESLLRDVATACSADGFVPEEDSLEPVLEKLCRSALVVA